MYEFGFGEKAHVLRGFSLLLAVVQANRQSNKPQPIRWEHIESESKLGLVFEYSLYGTDHEIAVWCYKTGYTIEFFKRDSNFDGPQVGYRARLCQRPEEVLFELDKYVSSNEASRPYDARRHRRRLAADNQAVTSHSQAITSEVTA